MIGNRPQFVKAAAVSGPLRAEHEELLVHTGQHFDHDLSGVFFAELGIPAPDRELGLGGGTNTEQTGRMLSALGPLVAAETPDAVLVYGDTNSTLAGALAGAQARVPVAHVEAGMRSGDRSMPEELNRVLADHASDLLLCSTPDAARTLASERAAGRVEVVGDVMVDVALRVQPVARARREVPAAYRVEPGGYLLVTAHRAQNVDDPARLARLRDVLLSLPAPVVFPVHPRTRARFEAAGLLDGLPGVTLTPPLGYGEFTALLCQARAVLTDSGGVQKEAYLARIPCLTLRASTEWTETVTAGWNTLVDLDPGAVRAALDRSPPSAHPPLYGDGRAGERVAAALGILAA